jgi:hypothetical protein
MIIPARCVPDRDASNRGAMRTRGRISPSAEPVFSTAAGSKRWCEYQLIVAGLFGESRRPRAVRARGQPGRDAVSSHCVAAPYSTLLGYGRKPLRKLRRPRPSLAETVMIPPTLKRGTRQATIGGSGRRPPLRDGPRPSWKRAWRIETSLRCSERGQEVRATERPKQKPSCARWSTPKGGRPETPSAS